jgi:hypothetical protein
MLPTEPPKTDTSQNTNARSKFIETPEAEMIPFSRRESPPPLLRVIYTAPGAANIKLPRERIAKLSARPSPAGQILKPDMQPYL